MKSISRRQRTINKMDYDRVIKVIAEWISKGRKGNSPTPPSIVSTSEIRHVK